MRRGSKLTESVSRKMSKAQSRTKPFTSPRRLTNDAAYASTKKPPTRLAIVTAKNIGPRAVSSGGTELAERRDREREQLDEPIRGDGGHDAEREDTDVREVERRVCPGAHVADHLAVDRGQEQVRSRMVEEERSQGDEQRDGQRALLRRQRGRRHAREAE
jgi:hypothetical protein